MLFQFSCLSATDRAAKLRLLNFLSLFRDLQKPTRFGGGGGSSRIIPGSPKADAIRWGGGVVAPIFRAPNQLFTPHSVIFVSRDTHFGLIRQKSGFLAEKSFITQIPSIPGVFFTIPGDLEITRHFWRLPGIPGDLAGLHRAAIDCGEA